jgi:hypothetical protein
MGKSDRDCDCQLLGTYVCSPQEMNVLSFTTVMSAHVVHIATVRHYVKFTAIRWRFQVLLGQLHQPMPFPGTPLRDTQQYRKLFASPLLTARDSTKTQHQHVCRNSGHRTMEGFRARAPRHW